MSEDGRGTDRGRGGVHFFFFSLFVVVRAVDDDGDNELGLRSTPPRPERCFNEGDANSSSSSSISS
jgi:hypothetical protein